jgi:hypothetical protein
MEFTPDTLLSVAFTAAFTAWAGVVAYGVRGIRHDLQGISRRLDREAERLNSYIVQTETRLAVLEDRVNGA